MSLPNQEQVIVKTTEPVIQNLNMPDAPILETPAIAITQQQPVINQAQPVINQAQPVINQAQPVINQALAGYARASTAGYRYNPRATGREC